MASPNVFAAVESLERNKVTPEQIRALEDGATNPFTGKERSPGYRDILAARRELPVYAHYGELLNTYHKNQTMIVCAATGSGKSTQIPAMIMYDESGSSLKVACTQPRRLAASNLAKRVAMELEVQLGEEVGYRVGGRYVMDQNNKKSRLVFCTEGVVLGHVMKGAKLQKYACIIVDEAHERSAELDTLLLLMKKHQSDNDKRPDDQKIALPKLIIMSATLDASRFQKYFNDCPIVSIPGRCFTVDVRYAPKQDLGLSRGLLAAQSVCDICSSPATDTGDILVFLAGEDEIEQVCALIRRYAAGVDVRALYGNMPTEMQDAAIAAYGAPEDRPRRVIVSTNIAETSLTINGVVYVVDTGLCKQMVFNPRLRMHMLLTKPISKAAAAQRAGRAGRTRAGFCFRLYSKQEYDAMEESNEPAILTQPMDETALGLWRSGMVTIVDARWITAPHPETVARTCKDMIALGFLNPDKATLTPSGVSAASMPIAPLWYHAILAAQRHGCTMDMVIIAAMCVSKTPVFRRPAGYQQVADIALSAFKNRFSDHITLLNIYNAYGLVHDRARHRGEGTPSISVQNWCFEYGVSQRAMEEVAQSIANMLLPGLKKMKIPLTMVSAEDRTPILKALAEGLFLHTAIRKSGDRYRTVPENAEGLLSPTSSLAGMDHEWVVYDSFDLIGKKQYLQRATAINPEWLTDLPFFSDDHPSRTNMPPFMQQSLRNARARLVSTADSEVEPTVSTSSST